MVGWTHPTPPLRFDMPATVLLNGLKTQLTSADLHFTASLDLYRAFRVFKYQTLSTVVSIVHEMHVRFP